MEQSRARPRGAPGRPASSTWSLDRASEPACCTLLRSMPRCAANAARYPSTSSRTRFSPSQRRDDGTAPSPSARSPAARSSNCLKVIDASTAASTPARTLPPAPRAAPAAPRPARRLSAPPRPSPRSAPASGDRDLEREGPPRATTRHHGALSAAPRSTSPDPPDSSTAQTWPPSSHGRAPAQKPAASPSAHATRPPDPPARKAATDSPENTRTCRKRERRYSATTSKFQRSTCVPQAPEPSWF